MSVAVESKTHLASLLILGCFWASTLSTDPNHGLDKGNYSHHINYSRNILYNYSSNSHHNYSRNYNLLNNATSLLACQGEAMNITCPYGTVIRVLDANYGRTALWNSCGVGPIFCRYLPSRCLAQDRQVFFPPFTESRHS